MNELTVFTSDEFGELRTTTINGEPWFVAKDVTDSLGLDRTATRRLDDDEKAVRSTHTVGGAQDMTIVSLPGLLSLVLSSRKPGAKAYKRWVTHEVLPAIHRDGGYIAAEVNEPPEVILARALKIADETMHRQKQQIEELAPRARFADAVAASDGCILVGSLAKIMRQNGLNIGQNRLFERLRSDGYLCSFGRSRNVPTQRAMDMGLFRIKETVIGHADGSTTIQKAPLVTGKGQAYFVDRYCAEVVIDD